MILGRNSPDAETAFTIVPEPLHILPLAAPAAADACVHWLRAIIIYKINHSCLFHSVLSEKHYVLFLLLCLSWDESVFYQMIVRFSDVAGLLSSSAHLVCSSRLFTSLVQLACSSRRLTSSALLLCSSCMPISSSHLVCSSRLIKNTGIYLKTDYFFL